MSNWHDPPRRSRQGVLLLALLVHGALVVVMLHARTRVARVPASRVVTADIHT